MIVKCASFEKHNKFFEIGCDDLPPETPCSAIDVGTSVAAIGTARLSSTDIGTDDENNNDMVFDDPLPPKPSTTPDETDAKAAARVPDGGWGWWVVLGSSLGQALGGGLERSKGILYLQLLSRFQQSSSLTSWLLIVSSSVGLLIGPAVSWLCEKWSCRTVGFIGAVLTAVGLFISGFCTSLPLLYISLGLIAGVGRIFAYTPCLVVVGAYFERRLGLAVGLSTAGTGVGSFALPPLIELLFETYGYKGAFILLSAIMLNLLVAAAFFRPIRRNFPRRRSIIVVSTITDGKIAEYNKQELDNTSIPKKNSKSNGSVCSVFAPICKLLPDVRLLRNVAFTATCIQVLFYHMAKQATFMFLPALVVSKGLTVVQAAFLLSTTGICETIFKLITTVVLDAEPIKKYRLAIYSGAVMLMSVILLAFPFMTSFAQFLACAILYGLLSGTKSQKLIVIVDTQGQGHVTGSMGWLLLFQGFGSFLGPGIAAVYKDYVDDYDTILYLSAASQLLGGLSMVLGTVWLYCRQRPTPDLTVP